MFNVFNCKGEGAEGTRVIDGGRGQKTANTAKQYTERQETTYLPR